MRDAIHMRPMSMIASDPEAANAADLLLYRSGAFGPVAGCYAPIKGIVYVNPDSPSVFGQKPEEFVGYLPAPKHVLPPEEPSDFLEEVRARSMVLCVWRKGPHSVHAFAAHLAFWTKDSVFSDATVGTGDSLKEAIEKLSRLVVGKEILSPRGAKPFPHGMEVNL